MIIWEWVGMIGSILVLDLALSGDNALVLGAAAAGLPHRQRWYALLFGEAGAIVLRIIFSSIATIVLNIPWLQTAGAFVLLVIAVRLLADRSQGQGAQEETGGKTEGGTHKKQGEASLRTAALTILVADVTMSLDNVLAIGAAANGDIWPIVLGLVISIAIIVCGSALIAELMTRFVWLLDLASLVLAWTSATMMRDDLAMLTLSSGIPWLIAISRPLLPFHLSWLVLLLATATCSIVTTYNIYYRWHGRRIQQQQTQ
ncbi:MAG: TerC family protein [Ktedonobacteraceae bacterium]